MEVELAPDEAEDVAERHGLRFDPEIDRLRLFRGPTRLERLEIGGNSYVVVEGDLVVDGPIVDHYTSHSDISSLIVTGQAAAANMITGHSVHVGGNLDIRGLWFVVAWDDLNTIYVGGTATAVAFISIGAEPIRAKSRRFGKVFDSLDRAATTHTMEQILRPGIVDPKRRKQLRVLHDHMLDGAPILLP